MYIKTDGNSSYVHRKSNETQHSSRVCQKPSTFICKIAEKSNGTEPDHAYANQQQQVRSNIHYDYECVKIKLSSHWAHDSKENIDKNMTRFWDITVIASHGT